MKWSVKVPKVSDIIKRLEAEGKRLETAADEPGYGAGAQDAIKLMAQMGASLKTADALPSMKELYSPALHIAGLTSILDFSQGFASSFTEIGQRLTSALVPSIDLSFANLIDRNSIALPNINFGFIGDFDRFFQAQAEQQRQISEVCKELEINPDEPDEFYLEMSWEQLIGEAQAAHWIKETAQQGRMQTPEATIQLAQLLQTGRLSEYTFMRFRPVIFGNTPPVLSPAHRQKKGGPYETPIAEQIRIVEGWFKVKGKVTKERYAGQCAVNQSTLYRWEKALKESGLL